MDFTILDLPNKQTSWDQGKTWHADPNTHLTSGGKNYYVEAGKDPSNPANWLEDTMKGFHRSSPSNTIETHSTSTTPLSTPKGLDIPTDAYPKSGIDWESNPFMEKLLDALTGKVDTMEQDIDTFNQTALDNYTNLIRKALSSDILGRSLNDLGARNMLNSSFKKDVMADAVNRVVSGIGDKAYETEMTSAAQKVGIPERLGNLANLGQVSTDKLSLYRTLADILMSQ